MGRITVVDEDGNTDQISITVETYRTTYLDGTPDSADFPPRIRLLSNGAYLEFDREAQTFHDCTTGKTYRLANA